MRTGLSWLRKRTIGEPLYKRDNLRSGSTNFWYILDKFSDSWLVRYDLDHWKSSPLSNTDTFCLNFTIYTHIHSIFISITLPAYYKYVRKMLTSAIFL
jgi:hypothetical protein